MAWSACVLVNLPCWTGLGFRMLSTDRTGTELNSPIWEVKELHPWTVCSGLLDCIEWGHSLPTWAVEPWASWGPCEQVLVWSSLMLMGLVLWLCSAHTHSKGKITSSAKDVFQSSESVFVSALCLKRVSVIKLTLNFWAQGILLPQKKWLTLFSFGC